MIDLDPGKIIFMMGEHGVLLLPESSQDEIAVLAKTSCEGHGTRIRHRNFAVQLPREEEALRIGCRLATLGLVSEALSRSEGCGCFVAHFTMFS